MSPGIRSGVNCTRLVSTASAAASERTSSVLATPGTPSISTCPPLSRATSSPETAASWPTTALATSVRTAVERLTGGLGWHAQLRSWVVYLFLECGQVVGQSGQGGVVGHGPGASRSCTVARVAAGRARRPAPTSGRGRRTPGAGAGSASRRAGGRAQDAGGVRAVADPAVEPAAALRRLDGLDHHRSGSTTSGPSRRPRHSIVASTAAASSHRAGTSPRGSGRPTEPASPAATSRRSGTYHTSRSCWPSSRSATAALSASVDPVVGEHVGRRRAT